ncbi:MAG TPA: SgcJ/EcaC family oxidoreductase [Planctomycetota bacterium]
MRSPRAFLILALFAAACASGPPQPSRDERAIRGLVRDLVRADAAGDVDAVMAVYAADAVLMPPGGAEITGLDAIRDHYAAQFAGAVLQVGIGNRDLSVDGDHASMRGYTQGLVTPSGGEPVAFRHKFLMNLVRGADGVWRIHRLIWNEEPQGS